MTATAAPFSSTAKRQIARPEGAAKLASIDFNPGASDALTPVVIMHGLLGNSRNFQGWGAKLVKARRWYVHRIRSFCFGGSRVRDITQIVIVLLHVDSHL